MGLILDKAVKCMDASFKASPVDFLSSSEILSNVDELLMEFREKYKIPNDIQIGNADAVDDDYDNWRRDYDNLEVEIFNLCWGHIKTLMLDCGAGDVASEVLMAELFTDR